MVAASLWLAASRRATVDRLRSGQGQRVGRPPSPGSVRLSVVVPAYNEGRRIAETVAGLRSALGELAAAGDLEVVVVDDGSADDTAEQARRAGADQVLALPQNRGKGAAVRAGTLASNGRAVAFTDADLAYAPEQLLRFLDEVETGWDVVVGSRKHIEARILVRAHRLRALSGRVFNVLTQAVVLGQYRDTQCGLKAFRSDVARLIFSASRIDGFAFDVEIFHLVERNRLSLKEVPVALANTETSTVRVGVDAARMLRDLARIRWWSWQGAYERQPEAAGLLGTPR